MKNTKKLVLSALFMALGLVLPFLTMQIPAVGKMLSPMHIPVFLCGMLCGWQYGLIVGFILPLLRSILFSMPPMMPVGVCMAFELAAYGLVSGLLYSMLKKKGTAGIYCSLIAAMIVGRVVWGAARYLIAGVMHSEFTYKMFMAGAFLNAIPGIILHLILIPVIVKAVSGLMKD